MDGVPAEEDRDLEAGIPAFSQGDHAANLCRLVLKSPPHSARIRILKELFPDALFVHIVRDPYVVFSSTVHLWKTLYPSTDCNCRTIRG